MRPSPLIAFLCAAITLAGCAASGSGGVDGPVTVYLSLPLTGSRAADGRDAADGARLALDEAGGRAGDLEVKAEVLDDARGARWDPVAVGENARRAAQDSATAAYIGELDSEPTRTSLPITNEAGIVQVSPGAGAVDLTRPAEGYPDSPDRYRPSGDATFARVIPDDFAQAAAAAELASQLAAREYRTISDGTRFGDLMVSEFSSAGAEVGIRVVGGKRRAEGAFRVSDPDGIRLESNGLHLITAPLDPSNLSESGFGRDFAARFGRRPGPYAAYGYESMALVLDAITEAEDSDEFRPAIVDGVLEGERSDSILGPYSITPEGDTTLCALQPYELGGGDPVPGKPICPG